ncbi:MAG: MBL fold metallo-hydrolase [bacterium]|nr:MBL fold metallo-hydrolase [bacterium]
MSQQPYQFQIHNDEMFAENSYIVFRGPGRPCWIVDPGLAPQAEHIIAFVRDHKLTLEAVVLTHAHGDHIAGVDPVREALGPVPLYLGEPEWPMLADPRENLSVNIGLPLTVKNDGVHDLPEGTTLEFDGGTWQILDTSGHSPGGRSLYCAEEQVVIVGDALFAGGIGRMDFHHSDGPRLMRNLQEKLLTLPDETRVLSGHGPGTTIGTERATNPFLRGGI